MTATANPLVWTYSLWTVPSGTDGTSYGVSITASDKAGNPHAAATGVTSYTVDNTPPSITSVTMSSVGTPPPEDNKQADVLFDNPVFSDTSHSALLTTSLTVTDTTTTADVATITAISNTVGNTWRLTLSWSTTPTTNDQIKVAATSAASVYDAAGNAMAAGAGNTGSP